MDDNKNLEEIVYGNIRANNYNLYFSYDLYLLINKNLKYKKF